MTSFWSIADSTARRTAGLSNGGYSWLKRRQPISPVRSLTVDDELLVALELRHKVDRRVLPPIDLALLQRRRGGTGVGHEIPHDAVEIDDLRPGVEARLAVRARHVVGILLEDDALPGHALGGDEFERAAADRFRDLLKASVLASRSGMIAQ